MTRFSFGTNLKRSMKKLRFLDFIFVIFFFSLGIFLCLKAVTHSGSVVKVNAAGQRYEYSASQNGIYEVQGAAGKTVFEIKDGKVRIIDSCCPNKNCVNQGWHSPLVCLPNDVIISIEEQGEFDAISE